MGPGSNRIWLPLVRLSAFFCAVVVSGNVLFQAFYTPPAHANKVGRKRDFLSHKKRQIKRHVLRLRRFFHNLTIGPETAPTSETRPLGQPVVMMMAGAEPIAWTPDAPRDDQEALAAANDAPRDLPVAPPAAMQLEGPVFLPAADPAFPAFLWPEPPAAPPARTVDRMPEPSELHLPVLTPEVLEEWEEFGESNALIELGDGILEVPELIFDGVLTLANELVSRSGERVWTQDDDGGSLADRMLDFTIEPRQGHIFSEFMGHLAKREMRYFSKFGSSDLNTAGVQDGQEDVDHDELVEDQGKLLWDALRKTYFSKYKFRAEATIKDDAFYFNQWRGVDFVLLPPLMTGYLYYRGLEKKFSIGGTRLRVELEPFSKWKSRDNLTSGVSLHWTPRKDFPIGIIVSAGLYDGDPEVDFIGIGTSAGMARRAIYLQRGE